MFPYKSILYVLYGNWMRVTIIGNKREFKVRLDTVNNTILPVLYIRVVYVCV